VNHINGDKSDPRRSNLEYRTHRGNMEHARDLGLLATGENHHNAKLSNEEAGELKRRARNGERGVDLAREFNVSTATVSEIKNGNKRSAS
jgi:hypothetical protein